MNSYSPICYPENVTVHYYKHSSIGGVYVLHSHVNLNVTNYISAKLLQQKNRFLSRTHRIHCIYTYDPIDCRYFQPCHCYAKADELLRPF